MAIAISAPYPNFFTADGKPLEGGYVYIGVAGLNPIANPQASYWDEALTIPAPAEIRTTGGYIVYNGSPARLYVSGDYSILVADKNQKVIYSRVYNTLYDADLFLTTARGTLTRSMRIPPSFNINLILDGGIYSWTNAGTSNYPAGCGAADLFALEVFAAPDGAGIIYQRIIDISIAYSTERYSWERKSIDAGATWSAWQSPLYDSDYTAISPSATPYAVAPDRYFTTLLVTTGAGSFICNLPTAASSIGKTIRIIKIDSGLGAIQIAPNGADVIANAGNVSIYIGQQFRHVTLQSQAAGQWIIICGEWQPSQAIDTNGSHLSIGRLHLVPIGNTINRQLFSGAMPATGNWTAAIQATGICGIPNGAKAVRMQVVAYVNNGAAGSSVFQLHASDNNTNTPSATTGHPKIEANGYAADATTSAMSCVILDVPVSSAGQFYFYSRAVIIAGGGSSAIIATALGYYMGD